MKTHPLLLLLSILSVDAWINSPARPSSRSIDARRAPSTLFAILPPTPINEHDSDNVNNPTIHHNPVRREILLSTIALSIASSLSSSLPAFALVKGNAPPSTSMKPMTDKPKCVNVEECQEQAERKQAQAELPKGPPPKTTTTGTRYIDMDVGSSATTVKEGDQVTLYYKVLKLGKRSYDGLSGEGTVVFSRGYGLEDDEKAPGSKSFTTVVGSPENIGALNDAVVGMNIGGIRRFSILPQQGWEKPTRQCDGGPGGRGSGGELKTDYVVVPTATMVATEECFDKTKKPFPTTYAQERRMAQRFDQSLIMEVQVVGIQ